MASKPLQQPLAIRDFSRGMIQAVENPQMPAEAVRLAMNVNFDRISTVQLREGYTILGNQIAGTSSSINVNPTMDGVVARGN